MAIRPLHDSSSARMYQPISHAKQIDINLNELEEYCGIKPDDVEIADHLTDKTLPPVDANQAMDVMQLDKSEFKGEPPLKQPPIQFTFKSAVRLVVEVLNRNEKLRQAKDDSAILLFCPKAGGYLLRMLSNVETRRPDLVPSPPQYDWPFCSARRSDHNFWPGVILQMLYEQGHIKSYGRTDEFWVTMN